MTDIEEPENTVTEEPKAPTIGYLVSNKKFWVMSILSLGMYTLYWAYKSFLLLEVAKSKRPRLYAATHALFFCITFYRLMGLFEDAAAKEEVEVKLPKMPLALAYFFSPVVLVVFSKFSDDFAWKDVLQVVIEVLILFQLQRKIVQVNQTLRPSVQPIKNYGRKELVICVIGVLLAAILAVAPFIPNDAQYEYKPWRFVDKSNSQRWSEKSLKLVEIDNFWTRFAERQGRMDIARKKSSARNIAKVWLQEELPEIDPNIAWDLRVDPSDPNISILILSSRFHWGNRPMVDEMISRAPKIKRWKFMSSSPAAPLNEVADLYNVQDVGKFSDFTMECRETKEHLINIVYKEPLLSDAGSPESRKRALTIIDLLVGQDNEDQWVGFVDTEKCDKAPNKDESCKKFIADFNQLKEKLLALRFAKPVCDMNEEERQNAYDLLSDAYLIYPFDSRRFSKFGEKFCYFTVKKENKFKTPEEIENCMNDLDKALRAQKCACTLGGTFDQEDRFYFDLCVTDIDKTTRVLQDFSRKNKYGKDAWLEFYDDIWISEWIGMESDSEDPEMRYPDRLPK